MPLSPPSRNAAVPAEFLLSNYDFDLPEELIAQNPPELRGKSRLMLAGADAPCEHRMFEDLPGLLPANSLLVANNVRVLPARIKGFLPSGGKMELLLLTPFPLLEIEDEGEGRKSARIEALARPARQFRPGRKLEFGGGLHFYPEEAGEFGKVDGRLVWSGDLRQALENCGEMPLPPYIRRPGNREDALRYQTVFAKNDKAGAVAAPTAGLHFTPELKKELEKAGHRWAELTLYVGYGTFSPIRETDIRLHKMHTEWLEIPSVTVDALFAAKQAGRPVVAVGTTSARALEGTSGKLLSGRDFRGGTDIFIYPGYQFKIVDRLITNFHLPGSSLLLLVSAFAGREHMLSMYEEAVRNKYRFFSYGDAMLI